MADRVRKVNYCYVTVPGRAGQGVKILDAVQEAGVNLVGFSGFPVKGGTAQLDLIADNLTPIRRVAKKHGWKVSATKKGFHIQGDDRGGAVHRQLQKLADKRINVTAADAVSAGKNRYGMILWVKPKDYARAAKALNAR